MIFPGHKDRFYDRLLNWLRPAREPDSTATLPHATPGGESGRHALPETFGDRYKLLNMLGKGAFGMVFLARDQWIGRLIALKLLYKHLREDEDIYRRFLQEARIAGQLDHPNIVTIYDVEDDGQSACIVMEYLAGGHLGQRLREHGPLAPPAALLYLRGILSGLRAAHEKDVVHRDIKPRNILFDQHGKPKISDFGIAHLPLEAGGFALDDDHGVLGTPAYMAPEQMQPGGPIDPRADLYAVGLLLYEMLTGRRRHDFDTGLDLAAMRQQLREARPFTSSDFPPAVGPSVVELARRLTAPAAADRYPNAAAAESAVDELLVELQAPRPEAPPAPELAGSPSNRREMFADILRLFLVDGVISPPERHELGKRARRLGVTPEEATALEEGIRQESGLPLLALLRQYELLCERLVSERGYSEEDRRILADAGALYSISQDEQRKIQEAVALRVPVAAKPAAALAATAVVPAAALAATQPITPPLPPSPPLSEPSHDALPRAHARRPRARRPQA